MPLILPSTFLFGATGVRGAQHGAGVECVNIIDTIDWLLLCEKSHSPVTLGRRPQSGTVLKTGNII